MAAKAMQRKAVRESLAACSEGLRKQVKGRRLLKRKHTLGVFEPSRKGSGLRLQ